VNVNPGAASMEMWLSLPAGQSWVCPECFLSVSIHDYMNREWRHLDMFGMRCRVHARVPRFDCIRHGIRQLPVPWAHPGSRFTILMEDFAAEIARQTTIRATANRLGLTWEEAKGIVSRSSRRVSV